MDNSFSSAEEEKDECFGFTIQQSVRSEENSFQFHASRNTLSQDVPNAEDTLQIEFQQ